MADNGASLRVDPLRLAVAGDSVGGNMAAAIILMAKQRRGPKIAFQVLFYPITDAGFDTPSYGRFADRPWLTRSAMEWFWDAYLPDPAARKQPTATPLNALPGQLTARVRSGTRSGACRPWSGRHRHVQCLSKWPHTKGGFREDLDGSDLA